jgi:tetratricopeptide (TPR) repeat protein
VDTPGNPFAELLPADTVERIRTSQPIGTLGEFVVYEILRGGMGEVFVCAFPDAEAQGPQVALKTFQRRFTFDRAVREAFVREVTVWSRLSGQVYVLPALGLQHHDGRMFVTMPLIPAGPGGIRTARDLLHAGPIDPEWTLTIALQVALALRNAGRVLDGLVHGDLKPENLLLAGRRAFVSDFGLARAAHDTDSAGLESTWAYRAPECWRSPPVVTVSADVYAFGALLFELVTGRLPRTATTRDGWLAAHRTPLADADPGTPLARSLLDLARHCLQADPTGRPTDFGWVFDELWKIANDHSPTITVDLTADVMHLRDVLSEQQQHFDEQRVRSLALLDQWEAALAEIDAVPGERRSARLLMYRGTALSMTGRDEEAIAAFQAADQAGLPAGDSLRCQMEAALSLKRLGQYDEAIDALRQLAAYAPADVRAEVVVNLGSAYVAAGRQHEAIDLLRGAAREFPDVWQLWGNLAQAQEMAGRYEDAYRAYQQGLAVAPHETALLVRLAAVSMEHLGDVGGAYAALDMAYDQGEASEEWFIRFQACNRLFGDKEVEAQLDAIARRDLGDHAADELAAHVTDLVERIRTRAGQVRDDEPQQRAEAPGRGAESAPKVSTTDGQPADRSTPFMNTRMYTDIGLYSVDFFYDPDRPDYAQCFQRGLQELQGNFRVRMPDFDLRATPFYWTRCPGCGAVVVTNRDVGKDLSCRWCMTTAATAVVRDDVLGALLGVLEDGLGLSRLDLTGHAQLLIVDTQDLDSATAVRDLAANAGFTELPQDHPAAVNLRLEAVRRGMMAPFNDQAVILRKIAEAGSECYVDWTPPEVERLLIAIRDDIGPVMSVSQYYDATADGDLVLAADNRTDELIERYQRMLADDPGNGTTAIVLAELYAAVGRLAEAIDTAAAVTRTQPQDAAAWGMLGRFLARDNKFAVAIEPLERSLSIDPVQPRILTYLAQCYGECGRPGEAALAAARAQSLGGLWTWTR